MDLSNLKPAKGSTKKRKRDRNIMIFNLKSNRRWAASVGCIRRSSGFDTWLDYRRPTED